MLETHNMLTKFTDTDCDIDLQLAHKYGLKLISMPYVFKGEEVFPYETWEKFDAETFFNELKATAKLPTTSAISIEKYRQYFEPEFQAGNDIFYVHFSEKMSGTFNAMRLAVNELLEKYPERKFYSLDTLGISATGRQVVEKVFGYINEGHTPEEAVAFGEEFRKHVATYFFADDLKFFAKSGRVSGLAAAFGGLFGIKPIIAMTDDGRMVSVDKAKGKMNAIKYLVDKYTELAETPGEGDVHVISAGSPSLQETIIQAMKAKYPNLTFTVYYLNPTAGCHAGPNTSGISFVAKHR